MTKQFRFALLLTLLSVSVVQAQTDVSKVWVADKGDGTYQNPVINADYSDPDVCRVGDDYYLVSSSFNCIPGLQILHSKDLVNWTIVGAAILNAQIPTEVFDKPQHGNGVWAPSIRYHNNELYIYYGDPDYGIYMTKASKAEGPWAPVTLVKAGKGLIDACPLWDEDGRAYVAHGFAGSRAGLKSILGCFEMSADGTKALSETRIIFDGHEKHETIEGAKFYKRNGYYYIFAPAGGVKPGWQVALRSKNVYGPYDDKIVLAQGKTDMTGPHQGAWVDTKTGEDWFLHFQDVYEYGRVVHLQPMKWVNDWPVMGIDKDGDGCGDPVWSYKKPNVGAVYPICTPQESDDFNGYTLGLQWQWHANPKPIWYFCNGSKSELRLYSVPLAADYKNLWDVPNLLMQKLPAREFNATAKVQFVPSPKFYGERAGLVMMGMDYASVTLENTEKGIVLSQNVCLKADKGSPETVNASIPFVGGDLWLRVKVASTGMCTFYYSNDGKLFKVIGEPFKAKEGRWIGAKTGLFITRNQASNDGGWLNVDWFNIDRDKK